jgi:[glutamine synthetase] adenylyltransferase / [glutamine synthetase]-adenylyl-L-tyrosine phosphorylase
VGLREAKRRTALLVALSDLGGVWALEEVTAALTRLADTAVETALQPNSRRSWRAASFPA